MERKLKLAILSPSKNAYSETFIQAHKNNLNAEVLYYYGGLIPKFLDKGYSLVSSKKRIINKFRTYFSKKFKLGIEYSLHDSFKKEKVQAVLAEYGPTACEVLEVCKSLRLPLIVHFHGYDASKFDVIRKYNSYKGLFLFATKIIVVSEEMKGQLLGLGCPIEKIVLNTYGPNDTFQLVNPQFSEPWLVGIGRFVDKKAPYYLLLAFKEVVKANPESKLILAGDGHLKNTCVNLAGYLGISENIEFKGVITPSDYIDLLSKSTAFVQHSITALDGDKEGTPLAVLEASSAGLPVISTIHAGIPDVIINDKTGILVEEHDVMGMAEAMIKMLSDLNLAKKMGAEGKRHITLNFSMQRHISTLDTVIVNCLNALK
ncbi:glycosyltransferase [Roseivirga sp.]|uniref:glycosyltransferase n=1 Tax=Roseivirga sp. TaxID=1964215 RepID=UPI003B8AFC01